MKYETEAMFHVGTRVTCESCSFSRLFSEDGDETNRAIDHAGRHEKFYPEHRVTVTLLQSKTPVKG